MCGLHAVEELPGFFLCRHRPFRHQFTISPMQFPRLETVPQFTAPITAMSAATLFIVLILFVRFSAARIQPPWPISPS